MQLTKLDKLWIEVKKEAIEAVKNDDFIVPYYEESIFYFDDDQASEAISKLIVDKLQIDKNMYNDARKLLNQVFGSKEVSELLAGDIQATLEREPACTSWLHALFFRKGMHALLSYRATHALVDKYPETAEFLHYQTCISLSADIHPRAKIGPRMFIDHGDSIVIGETTVIDEDVSILQDVTLGGTGKERGDRHPKLKRGVLIGAGSKVLGNITIGEMSKIGASSVVLQDIPPHSTAVGVPAKVIKTQTKCIPSKEMNHLDL